MNQDFKPVAIGGSNHFKAARLAEKIAEEDYGVSNIDTTGSREGDVPKVTYKDSPQVSIAPSGWGKVDQEGWARGLASGRRTRSELGGGGWIEGLKQAPDLIENSKRYKMGRGW